MSERESTDTKPESGEKPRNVAPDAVKDPNEKTEGKPGLGPSGGGSQNDETDPGGS